MTSTAAETQTEDQREYFAAVFKDGKHNYVFVGSKLPNGDIEKSVSFGKGNPPCQNWYDCFTSYTALCGNTATAKLYNHWHPLYQSFSEEYLAFAISKQKHDQFIREIKGLFPTIRIKEEKEEGVIPETTAAEVKCSPALEKLKSRVNKLNIFTNNCRHTAIEILRTYLDIDPGITAFAFGSLAPVKMRRNNISDPIYKTHPNTPFRLKLPKHLLTTSERSLNVAIMKKLPQIIEHKEDNLENNVNLLRQEYLRLFDQLSDVSDETQATLFSNLIDHLLPKPDLLIFPIPFFALYEKTYTGLSIANKKELEFVLKKYWETENTYQTIFIASILLAKHSWQAIFAVAHEKCQTERQNTQIIERTNNILLDMYAYQDQVDVLACYVLLCIITFGYYYWQHHDDQIVRIAENEIDTDKITNIDTTLSIKVREETNGTFYYGTHQQLKIIKKQTPSFLSRCCLFGRAVAKEVAEKAVTTPTIVAKI